MLRPPSIFSQMTKIWTKIFLRTFRDTQRYVLGSLKGSCFVQVLIRRDQNAGRGLSA